MKRTTIVALVALGTTLALAPAHGQQAEERSRDTKSYVPRIADIMILVQIRHSKLWSAGNARNWELADFALEELKKDLEELEKLHPTAEGVTIPPVIEALNAHELTDVAKAIEARDRAKFATAFDRLTAGCNACHQVTQHAFIVIQRPTAPPVTNQSFAPQRQGRPDARRKNRP